MSNSIHTAMQQGTRMDRSPLPWPSPGRTGAPLSETVFRKRYSLRARVPSASPTVNTAT